MEELNSVLIFKYIKKLEEDYEEDSNLFKQYRKLIYRINEKAEYWRKQGKDIVADDFEDLLKDEG